MSYEVFFGFWVFFTAGLLSFSIGIVSSVLPAPFTLVFANVLFTRSSGDLCG